MDLHACHGDELVARLEARGLRECGVRLAAQQPGTMEEVGENALAFSSEAKMQQEASAEAEFLNKMMELVSQQSPPSFLLEFVPRLLEFQKNRRSRSASYRLCASRSSCSTFFVARYLISSCSAIYH